jgi:cobalamin biosynthesis protein CbiG
MKNIPPPGKKWAQKYISELTRQLRTPFIIMDRAELEAIILTAQQFTDTNCGWLDYACKDAIIKIAQDRLRMITPSSQQKKHPLLKNKK